MNPEEFDKRLNESFKNEFLPPDSTLWQNIQLRVDNGTKKPFWYWLIPVVIVITALAGWMMSDHAPEKQKIAEQKQSQTFKNTVSEENSQKASKLEREESTTNESVKPEFKYKNESDARINKTASTISSEKKGYATASGISGTLNSSPATNYQGNQNYGILTTYFQPSSPPFYGTDQNLTSLQMNALTPPLIPQYSLDKEALIAYDSPFKNKKTYKSPYSKNPVDYDNKYWWSFGIGPQIAFNKTIVPSDSQAWVHQELWANKNKISGNGSGLQSQFLLGRKIGNYFSVETGIQYSHRTEDIKFNFTSYDVEHRNNSNIIDYYLRLKVFIVINKDTTFYDATRSFSLAVKNKYDIFTLPVKFNFEYPLSDHTKFYAGIGAGICYMTSKKSTHLNMVEDYREILNTKSHQFTASLNAQFGFYTNFNDIGQLGIYSGFQMYTKPWELSNKQYAISMSDLQLGISFRRPLNW